MKILHLIPSISPKRGGPSFAVKAMAQAMVSDNIEVHIATTNDHGNDHLPVTLDKPLLDEGVYYHYFQRQTRFYTFSWPLTLWLRQHLRDFDLVHIHSLFSYSTTIGAWLAHRYGIPYIIRPLGHLNRWGVENRRAALKQISLRWIEQPLLKRAALLHFTCEQEKLEAAEVGVSSPATILPLGIDTAPYNNLPSEGQFIAYHPQIENKWRLLFLSRIDPKKGIELLLAAFAQLRKSQPHCVLIIAGDGEPNYITELKALANKLEVADAVIWAGFLNGEDKLAAFAAADIFVLPSYSENFGIAVVEAMAAGLPVVISDQVGIHHEVAGNRAGLVTLCQTESVADAFFELVNHPHKCQTLGENGKALVNAQFSLMSMKKRLFSIYQECII